jgi:hypothetical protein
VGLMDLKREALTVFKADVNDLVRGYDRMKTEAKAFAQSTVDAAKSASDSFENFSRSIEKTYKSTKDSIHKIVEFSKESFEEFARHSRLANAAAGVDIERLSEASRGLVTEMDLLSDAAKFNHAQFKLTTEQMEIAERAMIALKRHGYEAAEAHDAILHAVVGLKTRGLEQLGLWVDKTGDSMNTTTGRAEVFGKIMEKLTELSNEVGDSQRTASEKIVAAGVSMENAWSRVHEEFGRLTTAAAPFAEVLAKIVGLAADAVDIALNGPKSEGPGHKALRYLAGDLRSRPREGIDQSALVELHQAPDGTWVDAQGRSYSSGGRDAQYPWGDSPTPPPGWEYQHEDWRIGADKMFNGDKPSLEALKDAGMALASFAKTFVADSWRGPMQTIKGGAHTPAIHENIWDDSIITQIRELAAPIIAEVLHQNEIITAHETGGALDLQNLKEMGESFDTEFARAKKSLEGFVEIVSREDRYADFQGRQSRGMLEKVFGPVDDFHLYQKSFEMLTGAVGSSLKAWIEGSESAGTAFKKFIGQAVEGLAVQMSIEALKFGAYAIASLVPGPFFNPAAASGYAVTAAEFAAGAAAAAIAARALGHGGTDYGKGAGKGGGAGAAAPSAGGGYGSGGSHVVYVIGDPYGDQTSRQRANNFKKQARAAIGDAMGRAA